ncbi:cell division protein FtsQ/DivIB [Staphylococcus intermedius]|uniref:Cell division protein DivIB n=1 Tax=Staphylococcus intermedius NCTC 11048 TaxID=1141106 RepID=A0A380G9A5_STAIN|nr:FtsQ-type POTRA domain-containing protein [Staphylococcus intermedius]PCF65157.1 cell division protein DivIB [Staphylococcus intermedius]PCF80767.1 cell division protein DivIB [Staphylococcus intermedius]PCF82116.1 cell division protein DivIB [Staphylococcus intermedius]PCF88452.1 cell division protein DivIB [Staphylococcus intermedius]PCF89167.1 cell division protein DivIB [Staphylococcus intermedius]
MTKEIPKINNEYLKEKRKKQRIQQRRIQRIIVGILLVIVLLILVYMFTPISHIKSADIKGNHYVSKQDILKELDIQNHPRIYAYSSDDAEERLKKNELIDEVTIKKGLFNPIEVNVKEHDIIAVTTEKSRVVPMIENGKVLKDYKQEVPNEAPYIEGFKGAEKRHLVDALQKMDRTTRAQISEIVSAPQKDQPHLIKLFMRDGIEVVGNTNTIADKLKYYPSMSQALEKDETGKLKQSGFIDLSVGATFIPYDNVNNAQSNSASAKEVQSGTASEDKAKDDLQKALNKIKDEESS